MERKQRHKSLCICDCIQIKHNHEDIFKRWAISDITLFHLLKAIEWKPSNIIYYLAAFLEM
jgi:hypothetical protein